MKINITPEKIQRLIKLGGLNEQDKRDLINLKNKLENREDFSEYLDPKFEKLFGTIINFFGTGEHKYEGNFDVNKLKKSIFQKRGK